MRDRLQKARKIFKGQSGWTDYGIDTCPALAHQHMIEAAKEILNLLRKKQSHSKEG